MIELRYDGAAGTGFWRRDYKVNALLLEFFTGVRDYCDANARWWGYVLENDLPSPQTTRWLQEKLGPWGNIHWAEEEMPGQLLLKLRGSEIPVLLTRIEQLTATSTGR